MTKKKPLKSSTDNKVILTPRENDVAKLLKQGHTSKIIAQKLGISKYTVDEIRTRLLRKTGKQNTPAMLIFIMENKII